MMNPHRYSLDGLLQRVEVPLCQERSASGSSAPAKQGSQRTDDVATLVKHDRGGVRGLRRPGLSKELVAGSEELRYVAGGIGTARGANVGVYGAELSGERGADGGGVGSRKYSEAEGRVHYLPIMASEGRSSPRLVRPPPGAELPTGPSVADTRNQRRGHEEENPI